MSSEKKVINVECEQEPLPGFDNVLHIRGNEERIAGALTELIVGFIKTPKNDRARFAREALERAIKK